MSNEDWAPVSIVLKDNSRILGFADMQDDIVKVRGAVEYHVELRGKDDSTTHIRDYDPATDDDYIVFNYDDMFCMNLMSDQFLIMFMRYHHEKNTLDFDDYDKGSNIVIGNYGVAH